MDKVNKHFKEYGVYYLVILLAVIIGFFIYFNQHRPKDERIVVDRSMFVDIDVSRVNVGVDQKMDFILFLGKDGCKPTYDTVPSVQLSMSQYQYNVNYIDIEEIDYESEEYKKFLDNLDYEVTVEGKTGRLSDFMGATPMFIIFKEGKIVYANVGSMDKETVNNAYLEYSVDDVTPTEENEN